MKTTLLLLALLATPLLTAHAQGDGPIKATMRVLPDGSTLTTVLNPATRTSEETVAQIDGKVLRKTIYTLNEQNFATAATHLDAKGVVRYKEVYTFDYAGRITESQLFSRDNRPLGKRVFIYDQKNQTQARIEDYDVNGNLITPQSRAAAASRARQPEVRRAQPKR